MSITRTAWTDDDGTGTTGTILNNAVKTTLYDQIDARWSRVTITSTGTQNNLSISEADYVIFNNATDLTVTGIVAPASPSKPGKPVRYRCAGAGNVFFAHENGGSTAANRLYNLVKSGNTPHAGGGTGTGTLVYDDAGARWVPIHHEQGAWIVPTFSAGNFSANGSMTWTVASGDVLSLSYHLSGSSMTVSFQIATSTVGGTPNTSLLIGNGAWGSFTATRPMINAVAWALDNNVLRQAFVEVAVSGTTINFRRADLANWTASTDLTYLYGQIAFEVT